MTIYAKDVVEKRENTMKKKTNGFITIKFQPVVFTAKEVGYILCVTPIYVQYVAKRLGMKKIVGQYRFDQHDFRSIFREMKKGKKFKWKVKYD